MRRFENTPCVDMPIYEYRCGDCGHEFETIQKVTEDPLKTCPACNENALVKKVSAAGFRLKGGGWYETDFKSGNKRNVAADGEASSGSGDRAKSEAGNGAGGESASKSDSGSKSDSASSGGAKAATGGSSSKSSDDS